MTCLDCGVPLPARRLGSRGTPSPRCDTCRRQHRRTIPSRLKVYYRCACGQPRASAAAQCHACYNADRRGPALVCEWCGTAFWRRAGEHDARRFCSKRCSGLRKAEDGSSPILQPEIIAARQLAAAMRKAQRLDDKARRRAEQQHSRALIRQHKRPDQRRTRHNHLCPDCGAWFHGPPAAVFCSPTCGQRYSRHGKYPYLQTIESVTERNKLAALISLIRQANRRLQEMGRSEDGEIPREGDRGPSNV